MFYLPNLPYAFYLAIKARHLAFFSAANPGIKSSGNGTESKFETLKLVPKEFVPKSILFRNGSSIESLLKEIKKAEICFPLIAKPDIGFRGLLVKVIANENELKHYLASYTIDFIIQEYIQLPLECGIFYHRKPNSKQGMISSLTTKKFISVTGDGKSKISELIQKDQRARLYRNYLSINFKDQLNLIPKKDEEIKLSTIGNHSKGTQFINGNHLISITLENTINAIAKKIPGWYFGRMDLRFHSFEGLEKGENFKILEINGIISEPTHSYDATKGTYFSALKAIRTHWKYLYEVSTINHKDFDIAYKSPLEFIRELKKLREYAKKISTLSTIKS